MQYITIPEIEMPWLQELERARRMAAEARKTWEMACAPAIEAQRTLKSAFEEIQSSAGLNNLQKAVEHQQRYFREATRGIRQLRNLQVHVPRYPAIPLAMMLEHRQGMPSTKPAPMTEMSYDDYMEGSFPCSDLAGR